MKLTGMLKHIIVIDADQDYRRSIVDAMQAIPSRVEAVSTLDQGVERIRQIMPDIIVVAIAMEVFRTKECPLHTLRMSPEFGHIPVVCLVEPDGLTDPHLVMAHGADDYLVKPACPFEVMQVVLQRLQRFGSVAYHQYQRAMALFRHTVLEVMLPHEFRTPLTSILGGLELLQERLPTLSMQAVQDVLRQVYLSGQRLHKVLEGILLYSKLEFISNDPEALTRLRTGEPSLAEVILKEVVVGTSLQFQRGQDVELILQPGTVMMPGNKKMLSISPEHLIVVIEQLTDNACRFSERGTPIVVTLEYTHNHCVLNITDKGRGMTPEQIVAIGAFTQFERSRYEQQGIGMGLALVKKILEVFEGELHVTSTPEQGTTMTIHLPCIEAPESALLAEETLHNS